MSVCTGVCGVQGSVQVGLVVGPTSPALFVVYEVITL